MAEDSAFNLTDFDQYVEEHGIAEEDWPAAFALSTPGPKRLGG